MTDKKCKRCGYKWQSRVEKPKACPACLSRKWDVEKEEGK